MPFGPFQKLTGPSQGLGGNPRHWYPAPLHCGSAQSTSPSQLSSTPLLQSSVAPAGHEQVPAAEQTCPTPGQFPFRVPQVTVPPQLFGIVPHTLPPVHAVSGVQQVFGAGPVEPSHTWVAAQPGVQIAVCVAPQLLVAVTDPHVACRRVQNAASVSSTHPHAPLELHVAGAVHVPHEVMVRLMPQLSGAVTAPQALPMRAHICGSVSRVQHTLTGVAGACEHSDPPVQAAHATTVPQLSVTLPHFPEQVVDGRLRVQPHTLAVVAPHP